MSSTHIVLLPGINFIIFRWSSIGFANLIFLALHGYRCAVDQGAEEVLIQGFSQVSLGPFLRGEADKRHYFNSFSSNNLEILFKLAKYSLCMLPSLALSRGLSSRSYSYMRLHRPCEIHSLLDSLTPSDISIIRSFYSCRVRSSLIESQTVGVHIRLGDFQAECNDAGSTYNVQMGYQYYDQAIKILKDEAEYIKAEEVRIFTDSPDSSAVTRLTAKYGCFIEGSRNVQSSILSLASSRVLVLSKSSFSLLALLLSVTVRVVVIPAQAPYLSIVKRLFPALRIILL